MQDKVVNCLINKIKKNNDIDEVKLEEIKYGLLGLYSLITKTGVILLLSLILNFLNELLLFMLFYVPLRSVGFGTHAKSNLHCWIFSTVLLMGLPYVFCNILVLNLTTKIIIWIICTLIFLVFCPADTEKRPMINKIRKLKFKIVLIFLDLVYLVLFLNFETISNYIIAALILQAFLSSPLGYILMGQKVRFCLDDINVFKQIKKGVK